MLKMLNISILSPCGTIYEHATQEVLNIYVQLML
jgi:hypothetical protein